MLFEYGDTHAVLGVSMEFYATNAMKPCVWRFDWENKK